MGNIDRYIVSAQITRGVINYDGEQVEKEIGPNWVYMKKSWVPEANTMVAIRHVNQVPAGFKPYMQPHKHTYNQVYAISAGLTCGVLMEGETREVTGPAGVYIPAGLIHTISPTRGKGYFVVVHGYGEEALV
ncbi:MAG: hypothetical protein HYX87_02880 [Chloroflexi bacterium]|nr:hypothetical protein [Chloroflexota bacterium]